MAYCTKPKNVCPVCDARGCVRTVPAGGAIHSPDFSTQTYRCPSCGASVRYCDLRQLTAPERAERTEHHRAMHREWMRDNAEHVRRRAREHRAESREELNARRRARYAADPAMRERIRAEHRRYYEANREKVKIANKRYVAEHFDEVQARKKRWKLMKLREGNDA